MLLDILWQALVRRMVTFYTNVTEGTHYEVVRTTRRMEVCIKFSTDFLYIISYWYYLYCEEFSSDWLKTWIMDMKLEIKGLI